MTTNSIEYQTKHQVEEKFVPSLPHHTSHMINGTSEGSALNNGSNITTGHDAPRMSANVPRPIHNIPNGNILSMTNLSGSGSHSQGNNSIYHSASSSFNPYIPSSSQHSNNEDRNHLPIVQRPDFNGALRIHSQQPSAILSDPSKLHSLEMPSTPTLTIPQSTPKPYTIPDERYLLLYEREARWSEVRKYSEYIRRFASESSHMEMTKENYYDLYNMAVCLLKSVDSLDPDKFSSVSGRKPEMPGPNISSGPPSFSMIQGSMQGGGMHQPEMDLLAPRKNFDYLYGGAKPEAYIRSEGAMYPPQPQPAYNASFGQNPAPVTKTVNVAMPSSIPTEQAKGQPKNFSGEVFFDDVNASNASDDGRRPKQREQRRRRTVYASRRNLHCHMCGVTETPEWRRGPAGDHTLCNACGLHYAKSLKKQKKEREGRKHSIEMLLNSGAQQNASAAPTTPETS
eukprot:TRINITY_DN293_c3_g1_i2.p1 TRINITY_DN293_c3_g1~~TRINITY_DN293_c3_g1_i2.p1  ORF type:complete len:454 (-),score=62.25 TRINITY_DN293_c3_g1_i2:58-1419(-)